MSRFSRIRARSILLSAAATVCAGIFPHPLLADTTATWTTNAVGNWSDATQWSTNPTVPNNSGGTLFDVVINSGTVGLDISPEVTLMTLANTNLNGPGTLTIDGLFTFSNATISAPVLANGGIAITNTNTAILGGVLTNSAGQTTTLFNSNIFLQSNSTASGLFVNNGTFLATGSTDTLLSNLGTVGSFINNSLITVNLTNALNINSGFKFANNGTISVQNGAANINAAQTASTGTFLVAAGTSLTFAGGDNQNFLPASTISGPGNVTFNTNGTVTLGGTFNVTGTTTLTNGYLAGTQTLQGPMVWGNETIVGVLTAAAGISIINTNVAVQGGTLTNNPGQTTTLFNSNIFLQNVPGGPGGVFINNGTFLATGSSDTLLTSMGTNGSFINNSLLTVSLTNAFNVNSGIAFTNNGTLNIVTGSVNIASDAAGSTGTYLVAAAGNLNFTGGNQNFLPGSSISGPGNVGFSTGGTVTLGGAYNVTGTTTLSNGYLRGTQTINGPLVWSNHTILGVITANAGISIINTNVALQGGTLTNNPGQTTTLFNSNIFLQNVPGGPGGVFINNGTFLATGSSDTLLTSMGTNGSFINNSLLTVSLTNAFNVNSGIAFTNNGTLNIVTGSVNIASDAAGSTGTYLVAAAGNLNFTGGNQNFLPGSSISGPGNVGFSTGGTVTLGGAYNVTGTTTLSNGYLRGTQTINGPLVWSNHTILGVITANAGISIINTNVALQSGTLTNTAGQTTTMLSSGLFLQSGGLFLNNGIFNATGTSDAFLSALGTTGVFTNAGLLNVGVTASFNINSGFTFNNAGTLTATLGAVNIGSGGTHTGAFIQTGGNILFAGGTHNFNAGASILVLNVSGGVLHFNAGTTVSSGGSVTLTAGVTTFAGGPDLPAKLTAFSLTNNNAQLDLTNTRLIIQSTSPADKTAKLTALSANISAGTAGSLWNGNGITSSTAAADSAHLGVGIFDNAILNFTTFGGTTSVDASSILIAVSHLGDANRNGVVDIQDQSIVTNNWQQPRNNWAAGDLNRDGFVDIQDLTIVTNNWQQTSNLNQTVSTLQNALGSQAPSTIVAIPEPATLLLLAPLLALPERRGRKTRARDRSYIS